MSKDYTTNPPKEVKPLSINSLYKGDPVEQHTRLLEPPILTVHHSEVPQNIVKDNPAEWYHPHSEETAELYSSKTIPTFTPNPSWTPQEYDDNFRKYEWLVFDLRDLYNKAVMSAKDLKYTPALPGYDPLGPLPIPVPGRKAPPYPWFIDAKGNYVNGYRYSNKNNNEARIKYSPFGDKSGDAFSYNSNTENNVYGFKHNTVSDLHDWKYDPHKAAIHHDYATRKGNVASWDRVEGVPTVSEVMPVRDGDEYIPVTRTLPDYSASLEGFTHANDNNTTRLPNSSGKVTIADLEASGLLSKPQTIQYKSTRYGQNDDGDWGYAERQSSEENARTARLQDLLTDRLLVPGKVDRSVLVSERLSDAIGDARRDAILDTATSNNWNNRKDDNLTKVLQAQTLGRAHLAGADNLSLPITFVDDVNKEGKDMNYAGDGLYTYLDHPFHMQSVDPRYKMYRDDGIIRVFTDKDSSTWTPGASKIELSESDQQRRNEELLDGMRTSSGTNKYNTGTIIGADYHHNDLPANGISRGDIRNDLLHEGIHAATGFNSNVIESQDLRNARILRDLVRKVGDRKVTDENYWKERNRIWENFSNLNYDPAHKTTTLGAVLGVSKEDPNKTSRGYASNSEAEMLRALHHAKSGFARHLISLDKLSPKEVVDTVQDPDKFLDFMQGVYRGSIKGLNDDPTSYSFPSSMSQVGTENEMARSIAGILPLIQTLLETRKHERAKLLLKSPILGEIDWSSPSPKDNHIFRNDAGNPNSIKWKELIYTPKEQLLLFRNNVWPQVRNNNGSDIYKTMA